MTALEVWQPLAPLPLPPPPADTDAPPTSPSPQPPLSPPPLARSRGGICSLHGQHAAVTVPLTAAIQRVSEAAGRGAARVGWPVRFAGGCVAGGSIAGLCRLLPWRLLARLYSGRCCCKGASWMETHWQCCSSCNIRLCCRAIPAWDGWTGMLLLLFQQCCRRNSSCCLRHCSLRATVADPEGLLTCFASLRFLLPSAGRPQRCTPWPSPRPPPTSSCCPPCSRQTT